MPVNKKRKSNSSKKLNKLPERKLSEIIIEFVKPLNDKNEDNNMEMIKKTIDFGILVWNISLLPIEDREQHKNMLMYDLGMNEDEQIKDAFNDMFNYLIARKNTLFKNDKRFIVNYEINGGEKIWNLTVAYEHVNKKL